MGKNVLIVYAHPEKRSFNAALLDVAVTTLEKEGHTVVVSDLYAMGFNPVLGRDDIKGLGSEFPEHINYCEATSKAWSEGGLADDIVMELNKLTAADLVIFQFPIQWSSVPAILKGWLDKILIMRYAFSDTEIFDLGKLRGKKAILSFTTGAPKSFYSETGPHGDMNITLWPIQNNVLRFVGFDVLPPNICYGLALPNMTPDLRQGIIEAWRQRLVNIWQEEPLHFIPMACFKMVDEKDPLKGTEVDVDKLRKEWSKWSDCELKHGPTVGQHLGQPIPKDTMLHSENKSTA